MLSLVNSTVRVCSQCFRFITQQASCPLCQNTRTLHNGVCSWPNVRSMTMDTLSKQMTSTSSMSLLSTTSRRCLMSTASLSRYNTDTLFGVHRSTTGLRDFNVTRSFSAVEPPPKKQMGKSEGKESPFSWKMVGFSAIGAVVVLLSMLYYKKDKELEREKRKNKSYGVAKLGGDWELTDHNGVRRSSVDYRGQWIFIYFGFCNCPDVCPEEMDKIVKVINQADKDKDMPTILPIMITVDPERDTPEVLKEYLAEFSPRLMGFTGTSKDIYKATRTFRVYLSAGPKDEDNDYIVDHSIITYLMNPKGEFCEYYGQNKTAPEIFASMKKHVAAYEKANK